MGNRSSIEYADATWNPVTGCDPITVGCDNCHAASLAFKMRGRCGFPSKDPFKVTIHPSRFVHPLKWLAPRKILVCSTGDLFHRDVPDRIIDEVFGVMWACMENGHREYDMTGHLFMLLTQRPERMADYMNENRRQKWAEVAAHRTGDDRLAERIAKSHKPHPRIWTGVSCSDQETYDLMTSHLKETPSALRFVALEPLLGYVDLGLRTGPSVDWVIVGGESGSNARPMNPDWCHFVKDQCGPYDIPFFFKNWGQWEPLGYPSGDVQNRKKAGEVHWNDDLFPVSYDWNGMANTMRRTKSREDGRMLDGKTYNVQPYVLPGAW